MSDPSNQSEPIIIVTDADLEDIVPIFLANRQKDIVAIQAALATGEYETIRILGHGMKGVGSSYGFDLVTELGIQFENGAREQDEKAISRALVQLEDYLKRVEVRYE